MSIVSSFASACKDINLVWATLMHDFASADLKKIEACGWTPVPVVRITTLAAMSGLPSMMGEGSYFKKGQHKQGSVEWYKDLAKIKYPDHAPGKITSLIGYNCEY